MEEKRTLIFASVVLAAAILFTPGLMGTAAADWQPTKNISWVVPVGPGGGFDAISRAVAQKMKKYLPGGVNVVVENKPGAGGRLANSYVWRSAPDGHTIGIINGVGAVAEWVTLKEKVQYDFEKFTYLAQISHVPNMISVPKSSPYRSIDDLRKAGKPLRVPTTGVGISDFFNGVVLCEALGIQMVSVAGYSSSNDCILGMVRGDSDLGFWSSAAVSFVESGDLIPLVVLDDERFETFPNVPCAKELGLVGEEFAGIFSTVRMIFAPPKLPQPITAYYTDLFRKVLNDPDFVKWSKEVKQVLHYAPPEQGLKALRKASSVYRKHEKAIDAAAKQISG